METGYHMPKDIKQFDINLVDDANATADTMIKNSVFVPSPNHSILWGASVTER